MYTLIFGGWYKWSLKAKLSILWVSSMITPERFGFTSWRTSPRHLQSSRSGIEYKDGEFLKFCKEHGIKRHFTVWRTPQQNGMAERLNWTIDEIARCIRLNARLPKVFWAEVVNMTCYILNWSPRIALDRKVAEEVWTGKEVDYSTMRIFGCPAYVHIPIKERSKLDSKDRKSVV